MKKFNSILKMSAFILFLVVMASCKKDEATPITYSPEQEAEMIKEWLAAMTSNKHDIDTTSTGIYYIVDTTKVVTGPTVMPGDEVTVIYTGMFLYGQSFDASSLHSEDGTVTYTHKTDPRIQGWEEAIEVLSKGGKAAFLVPSAKGYGSTGYGPIPPYTPLIFIIEVVDIK